MTIDPANVHDTLRRHQLVDGYDLVVDLERSSGPWIHDARGDERFFDAFTCFASWPLGFNHEDLKESSFTERVLRAARNKIANSDLYTSELAEFVEAFATHATPEGFPHHFWVSGGALAVENALKTAFDWKARKLGRNDFAEDVNDLVVIHFKQAFHGRSGYTLSLTNTLPDKVGLFPKFDWPRVSNPYCEFDLDGAISNNVEADEQEACAEIDAVFERHGDRVAAIIIEPMQGEGGDNHFRPEFLASLRAYADKHDALLIYDEVQTGFFGSGKPWFWQHDGVAPDIVSFGKKTQVCGIYASTRIDEIEDNVFARSSRINSTWGGNLVDMIRCTKFIEIIKRDSLVDRVTSVGDKVVDAMRGIARDSGAFANVRGRGSLIAFSFEDAERREQMLAALTGQKVLALPCGTRSVRFRLPLILEHADADELLSRTATAAASMATAAT